ncbi:MAG TPA: type II toxin-antitoxin system RelE/ParE family toxin [Bryobacteraceae bacterium]|nr:type II toxin-antitoxin system RelE/ParE family toxin [Bryobacteraceae bacterium]
MTYFVNVTARAERDLALLFDLINAEHSDDALKWYQGLKEAIFSLEEQPNRCPETPENSKLRHLLYGHKPHVYRVIYRITEKPKQVDILHIRHGARQRFKRSEVK